MPRRPILSFNLAVLLEDLERESEAMLAYRNALALDPQLRRRAFQSCAAHERAGSPKNALRHLLAYRRLIDKQGT